MKNSGEPKESTMGRTMGTARASMKAPKMEPNRAAVRTAPSARPASPFLRHGVAVDDGGRRRRLTRVCRRARR